MRVIGGKYRGYIINSPKGNRTHPMSEKMRGALFNVLGDIQGMEVLDAYAGSGAIGIEAYSRGASFVQFIENNKIAFDTIKKNITKLNIINYSLTRSNCVSWSLRNPNEKFDIIIIDPPYNEIKINYIIQLSSHITDQGILIISLPKDMIRVVIPRLKIIYDKNYSEGSIVFYSKNTKIIN